MNINGAFSSGSFDIIRGSRRWLIIAGQENKAFAAQAPYTESRLTRSVANERVGFSVVEHTESSLLNKY